MHLEVCKLERAGLAYRRQILEDVSALGESDTRGQREGAPPLGGSTCVGSSA